VPGIGPARLRLLLDHYGDIELAWRANPDELATIGLDKRAIENLARVREGFNPEAELKKLDRLNVTLLIWDSPTYPRLLAEVDNPPPVLYLRGSQAPQDEWAVAVVGTRKATAYGKDVTRLIVGDLAKNGVTIVSGLAYGIDTVAHQAALDFNGRTLAVLGCGVDVVYPAENRKLSQAIIENGALISEFPLGTQPDSSHFPRRNRIMSGLSLGTLLVEGSLKSGAMITAKYALEQGRDVFAVPGSILRECGEAPNHLIQNGAKLVTKAADILEELNLTLLAQHTEAREMIPDNDTEAVLLKALSADPTHIDDLGHATHLPPAELSSTLTLMELKGMVRHVGGMNYVLAR
jgi:DNA processing protein